MCSCAASGGLDHNASWALGCCDQGGCPSSLDVACLREAGCRVGAGAGSAIDPLALSRNADEPEAGVGGSRVDVEDAGAFLNFPFSRGRREGPMRDSLLWSL